MQDSRYYPEVLEQLVAERSLEDDELTVFFHCGATHFEVAVTVSFSEKGDVEAATLEAFRQVESEFFFDGFRWLAWDANDLVSVFLKLLHRQDLNGLPARILLARALHEVLSADGVIAPQEQQLFDQLCSEFTLMPDFPPLTADDLGDLSKRAREAVFAFCAAMAMCDFELLPVEEEVLERLAGALGVSSLRRWELKEAARHYLVDRLFQDSDENDPLGAAVIKAAALGVSAEQVERLWERRALRLGHDHQAPESDSPLPELLDGWMISGAQGDA